MLTPTPTPTAIPTATATRTLTPTPTATPPPRVTCGGGEGFCERLLEEAYTIVQGRVTSPRLDLQRAEPSTTDNGYSYRVWDVEVERYLKNPQPWETIRVRTFASWITHCGPPEPPMKEPSLKEGEPVLLFLNKRNRPFENYPEVLLESDEFTIAGPYSDMVFGKFSIEEGNARAWAFSPTMGGPWEPLADILAVVEGAVAGTGSTPTPMYLVSREEAIENAMAVFSQPRPEVTEVENLHDPEAHLMRLGVAEDLLHRSRSYMDPGSPVWVVQVRGRASDAGIVPPESRKEYSYAAAIIDGQDVATVIGTKYTNTPIFTPLRPGTLSGEITGLDPGDKVMFQLEQYLPETGTTTGTPLCTFGGSNGSWEAEDIPLAPGSYAIVPKAEGYLSLPKAIHFEVPEKGVFWRDTLMDFEMFRPENAIERFGKPLCGYRDNQTTPTPPATNHAGEKATPAPPSPGDLDSGSCFGGYKFYAWHMNIGMSGDIDGLPEGTKATVNIQLLPKVPGETYYKLGPSRDVLYPPELTPLESLEGLEPTETVATLEVHNGYWGLVDPSLSGDRYLVTVEAPGYELEPEGYVVVVFVEKVPNRVRDVDFTRSGS